MREPTTGLLVFLVGAALLALLGLGTETGVVEIPAVAAAAPEQAGDRVAAAAGLVTGGALPAARRGGAAGTLERGVRS